MLSQYARRGSITRSSNGGVSSVQASLQSPVQLNKNVPYSPKERSLQSPVQLNKNVVSVTPLKGVTGVTGSESATGGAAATVGVTDSVTSGKRDGWQHSLSVEVPTPSHSAHYDAATAAVVEMEVARALAQAAQRISAHFDIHKAGVDRYEEQRSRGAEEHPCSFLLTMVCYGVLGY